MPDSNYTDHDPLNPNYHSQVEQLYDTASEEAEYIWTDDARAFLGAIDAARLVLSDAAIQELQSEKDSRYGNAYAWMTRAIAATIVRGDQSEFSVIRPATQEWSDEKNEYISHPAQDIAELATTGSAGADLLIDLMKQTAAAREFGLTTSDIPVTTFTHSFKRDSCRDVERYFAEAASGYCHPLQFETVAINDKKFWHKTLGASTYINLEELAYNGVILPAGCVFREEEDGGFLFMRVTGLAFDQPTAESLFGEGITHLKKETGGPKILETVFRTFQEARRSVASQTYRP